MTKVEENQLVTAINRDTYVQLAVVIAVLGGVWWFALQSGKLQQSVDTMSAEVILIRQQLSQASVDRWTASQQNEYATRVADQLNNVERALLRLDERVDNIEIKYASKPKGD